MCLCWSAILCAELKSRAHKAARVWLQHSSRKCKKRGLISGAAGRICGLLWARERGGAARPQADGFPCGPSPQGEKVWEARAKDRWASSVRKFFPTGGISKRGASHQVAVMGISAGGHDGGQHQRSSQVKAAPGAAPPQLHTGWVSLAVRPGYRIGTRAQEHCARCGHQGSEKFSLLFSL